MQVRVAERRLDKLESAVKPAKRAVEDARREVALELNEVEVARRARALLLVRAAREGVLRPEDVDRCWARFIWDATCELREEQKAARAAPRPLQGVINLTQVSAEELREAAWWMEDEPGMSLQEAIEVVRSYEFASHLA